MQLQLTPKQERQHNLAGTGECSPCKDETAQGQGFGRWSSTRSKVRGGEERFLFPLTFQNHYGSWNLREIVCACL